MATSMQYMNGHVSGLQPTTAAQMTAMPQMPSGMYSGMSASNGMAFSFRQRFDRVDWKKLASADVDNISRTLDFNTLQDNIMNVAFCSIEAEVDIRLIDPNFMKLFKLAQLTIEYLLHSQDYLSGMVQGLEEKLQKAMEEHGETSRQLERQQQELAEVKKESHKRKKMLVAQQHIINNGNANNYNKCPYCTKGFVNQTFMQAHLMRRHSELMSQMASSNQQGSQPDTTAPPPLPSGTTETQSSVNDSVVRELDALRERLRLTESQLMEERNLRNTTLKRENSEMEKIQKEKKHQHETWKEKLKEQKHETERMQQMYQKELREMAEKQAAAQRSLEKIQKRGLHSSNLGALVDDDDDTRNEAMLLRQQREEVAVLREKLSQKLSTEDNSRYSEQEDQWKSHMAAMAAKHKEEMKKLEEQLQNKVSKKKKQETVETVEIIETTETKTVSESKKHLDIPANDVQDFSYSSPEPTARSKTPEPVKTASEPAMYVESDPEDFSDEEEGELLHERTDLNSTMGTTLGQTGTLTTLSGTWNIKSCRLLEQLKRDPNLVLAIKDELRDMLDNSLERRGIAKGTKGISSKMLEKQLDTTKAERQKAAAKLPSIYDIRQNYITQMENTAREQYKKQQKEFSASAPVLPTSGSSNLQRTPNNSSIPLNRASSLERSTPKPIASAGIPKPAPRSSRDPNRTLGSTISGASFTQTSTNGVLTTKSATSLTGTSMTGTSYTGTSYTSYTGTLTDTGKSIGTTGTFDSDEDDSYTETENQDDLDGGAPSPTPRKTIVARPVSNNTTNDEDDSLWSNASDLDDITPRDYPPSSSLPQPKIISSPIGTPKPRGQLVASLTAEIESQLANRGKKPAGGKNTVVDDDDDSGKGSRRGRRSTGEEEDDDDFSISSLEEDSLIGKNNGFQRRTPIRNSGAETDMSSNTLGTSMWGSSRDKPTPNPRKSQSIDISQASTGASRSSLSSSLR